MSTITIVGGTGYAGSSIAKEAASRGHDVTAFSRSQAAERVEGVTYVQGSITEARDPFAGADVVVAALSPRGDNAGTLVSTYLELARQATDAGARFIVIGGFGALRPAPGAPRFAEGDDMPAEYAAEAKEMNNVRAALEESAPEGLDWIFVSPPAGYGGYSPVGEPRGEYRTSYDVALFGEDGPSWIEGADFAFAVVDEIEQANHRRTQLHFAY